MVGAIAIGGDQLVPSGGGGGGSRFPGLVITLGVIIAGVVVTAHARHGPLAAAGVAASAAALVPFFEFLTYSDGAAPSFNTVLFLSFAGWTVGYLMGPGRGHGLYLALSLIGAWVWFLEATERVFSFPTDVLRGLGDFFSVSGESPVRSFGRGPNLTSVAVYTLFFAAAYLAAGTVLDRRGRRAAGTPFAFAGIVTMVAGIAFLSSDLKQVGTGLAFAAAGVVLLYLGATASRRGTNWSGAALVFVGMTVVLVDPFDTAAAFGLAAMIGGGIVIALAHVIATRFNEPPETVDTPSRFYRAGSVQPSGPPPPPAGSVLG